MFGKHFHISNSGRQILDNSICLLCKDRLSVCSVTTGGAYYQRKNNEPDARSGKTDDEHGGACSIKDVFYVFTSLLKTGWFDSTIIYTTQCPKRSEGNLN